MADEASPRGGEHPDGGLPPVGGRGGLGRAAGVERRERFAAPGRFAGYALHDPLGREIGRVEKLFLNGEGGPEYVAVRIGGLWGRKSVLIPVESIRVDDGDRVLVLG